MFDILSPIQFSELTNDPSFVYDSGQDIIVAFNPFDEESLTQVWNLISQLRDVFF